jgi:hypothetical protein
MRNPDSFAKSLGVIVICWAVCISGKARSGKIISKYRHKYVFLYGFGVCFVLLCFIEKAVVLGVVVEVGGCQNYFTTCNWVCGVVLHSAGFALVSCSLEANKVAYQLSIWRIIFAFDRHFQGTFIR